MPFSSILRVIIFNMFHIKLKHIPFKQTREALHYFRNNE